MSSGKNIYASATDLAHVKAAYAVLDELLEAADAADPADLYALASQRRGWARSRMVDLGVLGVDRRPVLVDPSTLRPIASRQGQPLTEVITGTAVGQTALASAVVSMPSWHRARAHVHEVTDVVVVVLDGPAVTAWWDAHGRMQTIEQTAGQHLLIPAGVPHAALSGPRPVRALEFRSNSEIAADNHLIRELDGEVMALHVRMRTEPGTAA
jgi:uncharacterized RmlC-like cupin family protein